MVKVRPGAGKTTPRYSCGVCFMTIEDEQDLRTCYFENL